MLVRVRCLGAAASLLASGALADQGASSCPKLSVSLKSALQGAISQAHGQLGLGLNMWATVVAPDGRLCYVAFSSDNAIQGQ